MMDGASFCGACGNKSGGVAVQVVERPQVANNISKMDRQELLATFKEAIRVLYGYEACRELMAEQLDETEDFDIAIRQAPGIQMKRELRKEWRKRDQEVKELHPDLAKKELIFSFIAAPCFFLLILGVVMLIAPSVTSSLPLLLIFISLPPLVMALSIDSKWRKAKSEYNDKLKQNKLASVQRNEQPKIDAALIACERSVALNTVPPAYRYTYALEQMTRILQNFLADNWKECADKYEEHMHRMRLESQMEEINELAEISAFYSQQAKRSAGAAALFSGLNFFFG
ncbi:MAG: hypothetical protein FWD39_06895 [Clostridiales bacterium]|nr:hypothetical protein [Clostridiales bacterium]